MTNYAVFGFRASAALHVATFATVLAWSSFAPELPHYHVQRGVVTLDVSFAALQPQSESVESVSLTPVNADLQPQPIEAIVLSPAAIELHPLRTSLVVSRAEIKLPAELEACDCHVADQKLQTPKRQSDDEPQIVAAALQQQPIARTEPVAEFTVRTEVSLPSSPQPVGSDVDEPPRKIASNRPPPYPPDAFQRGQQGRVVLEVQVTAQGTVQSLHVAESSGVASLDRSALDAVALWRFEPARRFGRSVEAVVNVPVRFTIR